MNTTPVGGESHEKITEGERIKRLTELGVELNGAQMEWDGYCLFGFVGEGKTSDGIWARIDEIKRERYELMTTSERLVTFGQALSAIKGLNDSKPSGVEHRFSIEQVVKKAFGVIPEGYLDPGVKDAFSFVMQSSPWLSAESEEE